MVDKNAAISLYADDIARIAPNENSLQIKYYLGTDRKSSESSITSEVVKNPGMIGMLKKLFGIERHVEEIKVSMTEEKFLQESLKVGRKKIHHRKIVPVIIWDFGGQDVFYSTHQTFLTYRAIYLIVLDGHRNLDDPCPFEQYLPGKSGPKTARGNLDSVEVISNNLDL
ncbi:Hypothetical predicted protein [Mytilus galloprovincialis]|uniref:Uncharacterized protein n=1 Tax=Mytilus galloprovincialis TaxID=29158 RepID=A0A8B6CC26_MYTGA|nr:Hypothetical predicted protein [Mytilus galloprovincialis]